LLVEVRRTQLRAQRRSGGEIAALERGEHEWKEPAASRVSRAEDGARVTDAFAPRVPGRARGITGPKASAQQ
jgi:hypothetical protein